jgi:hypothetical protein
MTANRLTYIFFISICLLAEVNPTYGQAPDAKLGQLIRVGNNKPRLDSLLRIVSTQTDIVFSFNTQKVDSSKPVLLNKETLTIHKILILIEQQHNLSFISLQNHIVLQEKKTISQKVEATQKSKRFILPSKIQVDKESPPAIVGQHEMAMMPRQSIEKPTEEVSSTAEELKTFDSVDNSIASMVSDDKPMADQKLDSLKEDSVQLPRSEEPKEMTRDLPLAKDNNEMKKKNVVTPLLKMSLTSDEVLYAGAQASVGISYLHGIVSWNTDFHFSHYRYGIGTSWKIKRDWNISLFATTGALKSDFKSQDSLLLNQIEIKVQFNKIGITVERRLKNNMSVSAGISLNTLSREYFLNGATSSADSVYGVTKKRFYSIKPPDFEENIALEKSKIQKNMWIGYQVSVSFYFLRNRRG